MSAASSPPTSPYYSPINNSSPHHQHVPFSDTDNEEEESAPYHHHDNDMPAPEAESASHHDDEVLSQQQQQKPESVAEEYYQEALLDEEYRHLQDMPEEDDASEEHPHDDHSSSRDYHYNQQQQQQYSPDDYDSEENNEDALLWDDDQEDLPDPDQQHHKPDDKYPFKPHISPFAKQLKQDHISLRAQKVLEQSNKKLQEIAQQLEQKYNNFSYKPKINEEYIMKKQRSKFHDSIDERVHEKEQYYKKMEQKRQEQMQHDYTYKPEISTYSKTLERQEPIHERLYKLRRVNDSQDASFDEDAARDSLPLSARRRSTGSNGTASGRRSSADGQRYSFQPQINDSHAHLHARRKGKIEDRMYQEAQLREQKREQEKRAKEQQEDQLRQKSQQVSSKTRRLAKQRLEKEMKIAFDKVATEPDDASTDGTEPVIDYVALGRCLALLGLFKTGTSHEERRSEQEVRVHEEIWNLMDPNEEDAVDFATFRAVLGPLINPELFVTVSGGIDSSVQIDRHTVRQLSSRIKELSVNKLAYYKTSNLLNDSRAAGKPPKFEEPTFAPKINKVSKNIDTRNKKRTSQSTGGKSSAPRYEMLFQKNNEKQFKIDRLKRSVDEKLMKECSFKPQLHTKKYRPRKNKASNSESGSNRFEQLYNQRKKQSKPKTQYVRSEEKELANCTFQPDIRASKQYRASRRPHSSVNRSEIKGFDKQIARMKKAHKERNHVNNFYDSLRKEIDTKWNNRMKSNGSEIEPTEVKPFNFHLDQRKRSRPLLYMDVNLGPGRTGRIGIHENDNPAVLAKNFAISYRLDQVLRSRLEDLIRQNMMNNDIPIGQRSSPGASGKGGVPHEDDSGSLSARRSRMGNSSSPAARSGSQSARGRPQQQPYSAAKSPAAMYARGGSVQEKHSPRHNRTAGGSSYGASPSAQHYENHRAYSSYEDEEPEDFQASPLVTRGHQEHYPRSPPLRSSSPRLRAAEAPNPEPSPSRRLYDSLQELKDFTESTATSDY